MIDYLNMSNVVGFEKFANPNPFPKITIILGKNDVCKTALIKMMYAVGKSTELYEKQQIHEKADPFKSLFSEKLQSVYGIKKMLNELVRKNGTPKKLSVEMKLSGGQTQKVEFSYGIDTKTMVSDVKISQNTSVKEGTNYIFIPAKEVLTAFNTIKAIVRQYFYPGWDDTTLDLIDLLDIPVKEEISSTFCEVIKQMHEMFAGELRQINSSERFVYKRMGADHMMALTAEGVKHIGILTTLIANGQINKNTVLFLDEPEDNLHPGALRLLVKVLSMLADKGVQVFITTHSYFTLKQLHIESRKKKMDVSCCCLKRNEKGVVDSEFYNLREGIPENDISLETMAMLDEDLDADMVE